MAMPSGPFNASHTRDSVTSHSLASQSRRVCVYIQMRWIVDERLLIQMETQTQQFDEWEQVRILMVNMWSHCAN